jgi:hypothetical protein
MNILQKFYDLDINVKQKILKHFLLCIYNINEDEDIEDYRYLINEDELIKFLYTYNILP